LAATASWRFGQKVEHVTLLIDQSKIVTLKNLLNIVKTDYWTFFKSIEANPISTTIGDRSGTVVKVLCYKSEGRWFDTNWCQWNFH